MLSLEQEVTASFFFEQFFSFYEEREMFTSRSLPRYGMHPICGGRLHEQFDNCVRLWRKKTTAQ